MILISKIFATVLALLVITRTLNDYKKRNENLQMTLFWIILWLIIIILAYYPILIEVISHKLNLGSTDLGTLSAIGMVFLLFVTYRVYAKSHRVEKQVESLTRKIALEKLEKNK